MRRIVNWKTTYVNRENTNRKLRREANRIMNSGKKNNLRHYQICNHQFEELSKKLREDRIKYMGHLLREEKDAPRMVAFNKNNNLI